MVFSSPIILVISHTYRLFIDGAHTIESLRLCVNWFRQQTASSANRKFMLFNVSGDRNACQMLDVVNETVTLQAALFAPNVARAAVIEDIAADRSGPEANAVYWRSLRCAEDDKASVVEAARVFDSVEQVLQYLHGQNDAAAVDVLVTGSLYMVAAVLEIVEAN